MTDRETRTGPFESFDLLDRGDVVQHLGSGISYVIDQHLGDGRVVLVRTLVASNPSEWFQVWPNHENYGKGSP